MNRIVIVSLFLLFLRAGVWGQGGYWEEAPGPYGGLVGLSPTNSNIVYAEHYKGGLYRSEDYGVQWERFSTTVVDTSAFSETLHIGYSGIFYKIVALLENSNVTRKLYRSTDEGTTWTLVNGNLSIFNLIEARTGVLIGSSHSSQLYRSINGGATWQLVHTANYPLSLYSFYSMSLPNGTILITDAGVGGSLSISLNNGQSWTDRTLPGFFTKPCLVSSGTIFALSSLGVQEFRRSTNGGQTWSLIPLPLAPNEELQSVLDLNNGRLLLSTNRNLFASDNDGLTWNLLPDFPEQPQGLLIGFPLPNGAILGTRNGALFRSSDDGATWSFSSEGIRQADAQQWVLLTDSLQMAVTPNGLWRTENAGHSWERLLPDTSIGYFYRKRPLAVLSPDTFAVSMGGNLWASTNAGQSFTIISPNEGLANQNVFAASGGHLFCSGASGVLRSGNLGGNWAPVLPGASLVAMDEHPAVGLFAFSAPTGDTYPITLRRSTDGGSTWAEINTLLLPPAQRQALAVDNAGKIYATGYYDHTIKLAVSADAGATWEYKVIPDIYAGFDLAVNAIGRIFTSAGLDIQILTSADGGDSWYALPRYSDNTSLLNELKISPSGHLYIVPSSGTQYRTTASTEIGAYITGHVRRDADAECSTPDAQAPLKNWVVSLKGANNWYANTNTDGRYTFFADTGTYTVRAQPSQNLWWGLCEAEQTIQSDSLFSTDTVDFAAIALAECPLISVSVGAPFLRRCFDNNAVVQYCNQGSETADSAWVDVFLDDHLALISTDLPNADLGNNTYRFHLGSVPSGDCGQFGVVVYVDCAGTVLGQTHCIAAHGYPDTLCTPVADWSGATVVAEAECQDSVVLLRLRNTGPVPSQSLPYIIIEDDVVLFQGQNTHAPGGQMILERPANGHTWRIESQQEPGHPFSTVAVAFSEGCGGFESLGFVNQFEVNTFTPSWDQVCLENIGAYDPNDKQGFPLGYGEQHRIRPGQELDYLIRFQNTGTDTAFNVFIRDTLSPWLDPASVRPGAASHPYTWTLSGGGVLQFTFANILLPDSNVNLAGSQGFVRFRVAQRPEVPIGAQIFNEAGIYFDFNDPIITNRTLHTVGIDYITSTAESDGDKRPAQVSVSPNPALDEVVFQLRDGVFNRHRIVLTDALGRVLRDETATGVRHLLRRKGLSAGVCFFRVEDAGGRWVGAGKVWWR